MKRIVLLGSLLFFISFYILPTSYCCERLILYEETSPMPSLKSLFPKRPQEGFSAEALVPTSFGYKKIKNIIQGDVVVDCKGEHKKVISATGVFVNKYIKLVIGDTDIYTGCDQIYYTYPECKQILAQNIKVADVLLNNAHEPCRVINAELINQFALLYYLTVEDHVFCITPKRFCVHNAEVLINGLTGIPLGCIIIANSILATIGVTLALSFIAHRSYEAYMQEDHISERGNLPKNVILAERSYYLQRSAELEALKQELVAIKSGLEGIQALYNGGLAFTYQFLKQTSMQNMHTQSKLLNISAENEVKLSNKQKENLRLVRECELKYLEQEIVNLQFALGFHINALIERLQCAENEYEKAQKEITEAAIVWNNNHDRIPNSIALHVYKAMLLDEHLLNNFNQALNELKIVAEYYTFCSSLCIRQSTNIIDLFDQLTPIITEYNQWAAAQKSRIDKNIIRIEKHFARYGISIAQIKNETKNYLEKGRNGRNTQAIAEAKEKLKAIVVAGGANRDPKKDGEDEEDERIKISEQDTKHIFRDSEGHFIKDTPKVRKIIEDVVADKNNFDGVDKYGTGWYSQVKSDGKQVWAGVRDGKIRYAGINKIPWAKDITTGLLIRPANSFKI